MHRSKVVNTIYQEQLSDLECRLVRNNLQRLASHPIVLLVPEDLSLDALREQFDVDSYEVVRVSPEWLGRKNGVAGYNRMMLSADFYSLFSDSEYILICQTDAYIDRDELLSWCDRGYDYIGAPWPMKSKYNLPLIRHYLALRRAMRRDRLNIMHQDLFNRVGNGGLSLRRVAKCLEVCQNYGDTIERFCTSKHNLHNEDVFWALIPDDMHYPSIAEALTFSIDLKPKQCFELSGKQIPFGIHGLTQPKYHDFWSNHIPLLKE